MFAHYEGVSLALSLASKATRSRPNCGTYWNTLGAAQCRAGDYSAAIDSLQNAKLLEQGGTAFDDFFLAIAHAQIGNHQRALHQLSEGEGWMDRNAPEHPELLRLREEARSNLLAGAETAASAD